MGLLRKTPCNGLFWGEAKIRGGRDEYVQERGKSERRKSLRRSMKRRYGKSGKRKGQCDLKQMTEFSKMDPILILKGASKEAV